MKSYKEALAIGDRIVGNIKSHKVNLGEKAAIAADPSIVSRWLDIVHHLTLIVATKLNSQSSLIPTHFIITNCAEE